MAPSLPMDTNRKILFDKLKSSVFVSGDASTFNESCVDIGLEAPLSIVGGVIRAHEDDDYNDAFALQWRKFKTQQFDHLNNTRMTLFRLKQTGWDIDNLGGKTVLEAGSGAGRFTWLFAEAKADLVTFDFSSAVNANFQNNGHFPNVLFFQADIFDMPFRRDCFDYVFCHGVLQHTPDPEGAFQKLCEMVRPGGRISIDVYLKDGKIRTWKSKYLWRWLTTRIKPEKLMAFLEWFIPKWLPFDTAIKRIPKIGNYLGSIVPCQNYMHTGLSKEDQLQWAVMDTFDALAPKYDIPMRVEDVRRWFIEAGFERIDVGLGGNGVLGNGEKPSG